MARTFKLIDERGNLIKGPWWSSPNWRIHGQKCYWPQAELLDLPLSDTVKKRIPRLRPGTKLLLYSTGRYSSTSIVLMDNDEIDALNEFTDLMTALNQAKAILKKAASKELKAVKDAEKKLVKHKKEMSKLRLR